MSTDQSRFSPAVLAARRGSSPGAPAYREHDGSAWRTVSWSHFVDEAASVAQALLERGLSRGSRVCLLGAGPKWVTAYLGAQMAGLIPVGIYDTSPLEDIRFIIQDCDAKVIFAPESSVLGADGAGNVGCDVIFFDNVASWSSFLRPPQWEQLDESIRKQAQTDTACLIYTSGTTGNSKGVLLSFANIDTFLNARVSATHSPATRALSFLPLSHLAGQGWTIWVQVAFGGQVWYGRGLPFLIEDLCECRPTTFFAPPRVYEGWYRGKRAFL